MKTSTLATGTPLVGSLGHRRIALALAIIVTLLAALAVPQAFAQDKPADPAAPAANPGDLPPVTHLVYLDQLPTPAALIKEAAAQGATIQRIDRTSDSVVVVCKYADGRTDTTGYTTLSAASTTEEPAVVAVPAAPANPPTYTVVSYQPAPVYYETRYRSYDPVDNFWAPLALGIGIGWVSGGHGGHYHGYNHGHGTWRH